MEEKWHKKQRVCYLFSWAFVVLCIACVLGLIVCIVVFGLKQDADGTLLLILTIGAAAGTVAFALAGVGLSKLSLHYALRERDVKELAVSEDSFFAGEGTFATFQKEGVLLHSIEQDKTKIFVPYSEMRVFTVCTRARARDKGEWSVVLEIPMRYLTKDKEAQTQSPALIELTYKPRLLASLQKYGVTVLGEEKGEEGKEAFEKIAKFTRHVPEKRKRALISVGVCVALWGVGLALLFTRSVSVSFGVIPMILGVSVAAREIASFFFEKAVVAVYREGIFWRSRKGEPRGTFLKWTEVKRVYVREEKEESVLVLDCGYGAYDCPLLNGVSECVAKTIPDLVEEEL